MIHFAPIRTRRLSVRLKEISIGDAIKLCTMAPERHEAAATEFLQMVLDEAKRLSEAHVTDPRAWTVQERMWCIASYLCVVSDGDFNFKVGDDAHFSDYLLAGVDLPAISTVKLSEIGGDKWTMRPLFGAEAEAIELCQYEREGKAGRFHWITGAMAAQLRRNGEDAPDAIISHVDYVRWLRERVKVFEKYSESDFTALLREFWIGQDKLSHFFRISFDNFGIVALPTQEAGEKICPARFPAVTCVSRIAAGLCGKSDDTGG